VTRLLRWSAGWNGERRASLVSGGKVCLHVQYHDLIVGAAFGAGTERAASERMAPTAANTPAVRRDGAYVGRSGNERASVVSTFHVRAIVFGILMTHVSRLWGFDGRSTLPC